MFWALRLWHMHDKSMTIQSIETTYAQKALERIMKFQAKDYSPLFQMKGFSRQLLENHFTLYEGYVTNTNKLLDTLSGMEKDGSNPQYGELKRRFGWEFNGMRLHEYYFNNLGGKAPLKKSPLQTAIETHFKSLEAWQKDFEATAAIRGSGWCILYFDSHSEQLFNTWINEHDQGHLSGCSPILVLDAFEHAYMIDYGLDRKEYIETFMRNARWDVAAERFELARQMVAASVI